MKKIISTTLILAFLWVWNNATAKNEISEKVKSERHALCKKDIKKIAIENKYGDIHFFNSPADSIIVEVTFVSDVDDKHSNIAKISTKVEVVDDILQIGTLRDKTVKGESVKSNYTIYFPKDIALHIVSSYGDVKLPSVENSIVLNMSYGNLNAKVIRVPKSSGILNLDHGHFNIDSAQNVVINCSHAEYIGNLLSRSTLKSKHSKLTIDMVKNLKLDSDYDIFNVNILNGFDAQSVYTQMNIDCVDSDFDLNSTYGKLHVNQILSTVHNLTIHGEFTPIDFHIKDDNVSMKVDCTTVYSKMNYPQSYQFNKAKQDDETTYKGLIGEDQNTKNKIFIVNKYANINLQ